MRIEIVAGPIEVRRHRAYVRQTVLSADRDKLCDTRKFSCGEALVGLFGRSGEERVLADRLLGEFGVGAARPKEKKAFDAVGDGAVE